MNGIGAAPKKPAGSEAAAAAELLQKYADLMREAGSPTGAWNPDPDEHTVSMLREDVQMSPNELKAVMLIKSCCMRQKPTGRTIWGFTEAGRPLRLTEIMAYFGWDKGNASKYLRRPLAWGFVRRNEHGQFGIGARVQGKFVEEPEDPKAQPSDDEVVCTDNLPEYLAIEIKRFSKTARRNFLLGWRQIKDQARQRLAAEKKRLYELEQKELTHHCKDFELELKRKSRDPADDANGESVHTTSVQDSAELVYKATNGSVRTGHIRNERKGQFYREEASSSSSAQATTTDEETEAVAKIASAIREHATTPDVAFLLQMWRDGRKKDPILTGDEVVKLIHERGKAKREPGMNFFRVALLNCLPLVRPRPLQATAAEQSIDLETEIREIEEFIADSSPENVNIPYLKRRLDELRAEKAERQRRANAKAQQAGRS